LSALGLYLLIPSLYWSGIAATVLAGVVAVGGVTWSLWRRYGTGAAFTGGIILACCPLFLQAATCFFPDIFQAAFLVLAVVVYVWAADHAGRGWSYALSGVLIGLATLSKQTGVFVFPVLAGHALLVGLRQGRSRRGATNVLWIIAGGAIVLLAYAVFCTWWYADPLHILGHVRHLSEATSAPREFAGERGDRMNFVRILFSSYFGWFGGLLLLATIITLFTGGPRIEAVFGLLYFAFLLFGTVNPFQYSQTWFNDRYLLPCVPFFALCFGYQFDRWLGYWRSRVADKGKPDRKITFVGWSLVGAAVIVSSLVWAVRFPPMFPVWKRTRMIYQAVYNPTRPVYATSWFKQNHAAVLPESVSAQIKVYPGSMDDMPERYCVVSTPMPYDRNRWKNIPWLHARVHGGRFESTRLRTLADAILNRDATRYERYYNPVFYRIEVDTTTPPARDIAAPPWETD
jgi:4-amino-4-deoxy-L-arabinose transferase-like glycosyltransferase